MHGTVQVNDVRVGTFRVGPGWRTFTFDLPKIDSEILKITITTKPRSSNLLVHAIKQEVTTRNWRLPDPLQNWVALPMDVASAGVYAGRVGFALIRPHLSRHGLRRGLKTLRGWLG